jgi:hypothetical protein
LYGTTQTGGTGAAGTVFKLLLNNGKWTLDVLYAFSGKGDGGYPNDGVIFGTSGDLYGTAAGGGIGNGTVFEVTP